MATQQSAFKQLYNEFLKVGGDFSKLPDSVPKKQIKCYVKEAFPYFLVTDNYFYLPCYFTKKAVEEFGSKYSNMKITDLKSQVVLISDWSLEMVKTNSSTNFTSYGGIEVKLIVKSFKPMVGGKVVLSRWPVNIYRDDEIKTLIQNYTHKCLTTAVKGSQKADSLPDASKKANVNAGIVSFASGNAFSAWQFKEGKTAIMDMETIFVAEKGKSALTKLKGDLGTQGKAKVVGKKVSAKKSKSAPKESGVSELSKKLAKFTPNKSGKQTNAKKSTKRIPSGKTPSMQTPHDKESAVSANLKSMAQFKKMMQWMKLKGQKNKSAKK